VVFVKTALNILKLWGGGTGGEYFKTLGGAVGAAIFKNNTGIWSELLIDYLKAHYQPPNTGIRTHAAQ